MLQIEFDAEETTILLSDFDAWNRVLNSTYISDNEEDFSSVYSWEKTIMGRNQAILEKVFDLDSYRFNWDYFLGRQSI